MPEAQIEAEPEPPSPFSAAALARRQGAEMNEVLTLVWTEAVAMEAARPNQRA